MFDKEAEEYANRCACLMEDIPIIERAYRNGAEFGYKQGQSDQLVHKQYQLNQLRKANEWHEIESKISPKREISKKYMPKNEEKVLLKYHFSGDDEIHISDGYYDAYDFMFHIANNPKHRIVCVIAWKEIKE